MKIVSVVMSVLMLITVFTACGGGGSGDTGGPAPTPAPATGGSGGGDSGGGTAAPEEPDWPSEISIFVGDPQRSPIPASDTAVGQKIKELTGVTLKIEYLVGQDIMEKANLMVAGGVYPDLIFGGDSPGLFVSGGALIPLDNLLDSYGDNIKKLYRPKEWELVRDQYDDKQIYVIPTNRGAIDDLYPSVGWYLNIDLLEQAGYPTPKTLGEFRDLIVEYVANNPTYDGQPTIGFSMGTEGARVSNLQFGAARFLSGFPNDGQTQVNQSTLEANVVMTQPSMKEFLKFMNEMWHAGLADPEMFMQQDDEYLAKLASGRVVAFYGQRWQVETVFSVMENDGMTDRAFVAFPIVMDGVREEFYRGPFGTNPTQGVAITTAAKDPDGIMRYLNRLAADDIQKLNNWGIEGEDYYLDDAGNFQRTQEQWDRTFDFDYRFVQGIGEFSNLMPRREQTRDDVYGAFDCGNWVNPNFHPDYFDIRYRDYEKDILSKYNAITFNDWFAPAYPQRYIAGWAVRQMAQGLDDQAMFISINTALEYATEWNTRITQAPTADLDRLWDEYQEILRGIPGLLDYEAFATEIIRNSNQFYE